MDKRTCMYMHINMCVFTYVYMYIYAHVYIYACIYMYNSIHMDSVTLQRRAREWI